MLYCAYGRNITQYDPTMNDNINTILWFYKDYNISLLVHEVIEVL